MGVSCRLNCFKLLIIGKCSKNYASLIIFINLNRYICKVSEVAFGGFF